MASSATDQVVVWEWFNEFGLWKPYLPHVSGFIESNNKAQTNPVNLGNVDGSLQMYIIDFSSMSQIRLGTGTSRQVRRALYPVDSHFGRGYIWQWEGDSPGEWHTYDVCVANIIENFYMQQNKATDILNLSHTTLNSPYIINFTKMQQERIGTGRFRKIRREKLTLQYPRVSQSQGSNTNHLGGSTSVVYGSVNPSVGPTSIKRPRLISSISAPPLIPGSLPMTGTPSSFGPSQHFGSPLTTSNPSFVPVVCNYLNTTSLTSVNTTSVTFSSPQNSISTSNTLNVPILSSGHLTRKRSLPSSNSVPSMAPIISLHPGLQNSVTSLSHSSLSAIPTHQYANAHLSQTGNRPAGAGMWMSGNIVNLHSGLQGMSPYTSAMYMSPMPSNLSIPTIPGGLPVPSSLFSKSRVASRISPVVSSATSVLASPAVPLLLSPTSSSASGATASHSDLPQEGRIPNNVPKSSKKQQSSGKSDTDIIFSKYATVLENPPEEEDCCICCEKMTHPSGYGEGQKEAAVVFRLSKCSHMFHKLCILAMYESSSKNGCLQCPACKTIYGEKHGNCPRGVMEYHRVPQPLPSYPPDCQTIRIVYQISPGTQGQEHPHPGKRYSTRGFPRIGFLPDTEKGRKVLQLLIVAWKRRLTFTIGTSATTGEGDTVTWNEIHHKTEFGTNYSGHGFPDPNYLDNVIMELAVHGVTEDDL